MDAVTDLTSIQPDNSSNVVEEQILLTDFGRRMFILVNFVAVCGLLSIFGVAANVINIIVFIKQGVTSSVNISLLGLAVTDLCSLLTLAVLSAFMNPYLEDANTILVPPEVVYLIAGWPHICFTRISCWITVYITAERCLCIALPLTVKRIITPNRTAAALGIISLVMIISLVPEYVSSYIGWKFFPASNRTRLGLLYTQQKQAMEGLVFIVNAILGMTSFPAVIVLTFILLLKLKLKRTWQKEAVRLKKNADSISNKDRKVMYMVALIASVLILCYTPDLFISLLFFVNPQFGILGNNYNLGISLWSFGVIFHAINASINIFIYYIMSSNYKQTFHELVCKVCKTDSSF